MQKKLLFFLEKLKIKTYFLKSPIKVLLFSIIFFCTFEISLNIFSLDSKNILSNYFPDYPPTNVFFHHDNPKNAILLKKKATGSNEKDITVNYNSLGCRGPEFDDRPKVLFLGDSFIEADEVAYEKTVGYLYQMNNPRFQVIQKGVSSWSPALYLSFLQKNLRSLKPEMLFIFLCWNDFYPWTTYRSADESYFYHSTNPLGEDNIFCSASSLRQRKQQFSILPKSIYAVKDLIVILLTRFSSFSEEQAPEIYTTPFSFWPLSAQRATKYSFNYINEIIRFCSSFGIKPVFIWIPHPLGLSGECNSNRLRFNAVSSLPDCGGLVDILNGFFKSKGIVFLDTRSAFVEIKKNNKNLLYFEVDGHFNEAGHSAMADVLQTKLKEDPYSK